MAEVVGALKLKRASERTPELLMGGRVVATVNRAHSLGVDGEFTHQVSRRPTAFHQAATTGFNLPDETIPLFSDEIGASLQRTKIGMMDRQPLGLILRSAPETTILLEGLIVDDQRILCLFHSQHSNAIWA
jgi:hypothetical protein